jgi:hypothetical protein
MTLTMKGKIKRNNKKIPFKTIKMYKRNKKAHTTSALYIVYWYQEFAFQ